MDPRNAGVAVVRLDTGAEGSSENRPPSGLDIDRLMRIKTLTISTLRYLFFLLCFSIGSWCT